MAILGRHQRAGWWRPASHVRRATSPLGRRLALRAVADDRPAPSISPKLRALLRRVKLGKLLDTVPEHLALAKTNGLAHSEFLELNLADEVARRDTTSAVLQARSAGLDPTMTMERWDPATAVTYDQAI